LRDAGGFLELTGSWIIAALQLSALERAAVSVGASMPVGMVVLVYAATEGLDAELAAGIVSLSILAGLIVMPVLLSVF
jgi:predicted permease